MKGARGIAELFKTGQYGRFYITSSSHARGVTLRVQVLPEGEEAKPNGRNNTCLNSNAVEVYGVINGNPGWTEEYGWIHEGPWQEDFEKLVRSKQMELDHQKQVDQAIDEISANIEKERVRKLLDNY